MLGEGVIERDVAKAIDLRITSVCRLQALKAVEEQLRGLLVLHMHTAQGVFAGAADPCRLAQLLVAVGLDRVPQAPQQGGPRPLQRPFVHMPPGALIVV
ncbi:hypothetical protein D3C77_634400 [compost metagenome]